MKTRLLYFSILALLAAVTGCKPSNRVTFKPALVSVDPGEGWKTVAIPTGAPACTPTLVGKGGMINAVMLDGEAADAKEMANKVQAMFAGNGKAIPDSFKQENFSTDSGLNGVHLSYTSRSDRPREADTRSHSFITRNGSRRYVSISYITSPSNESAAVLQAIGKTLRVE